LDRRQVISVSRDATVMDAVRAMVEGDVGITPVLEHGRLLGVVSQSDIVARVVLKNLDPETTAIADVMTSPVVTVRETADRGSTIRLMIDHDLHHLPVVDGEGRILAMLSMRQALRAEVHDLKQTVWEMAADTMLVVHGG
jgi:CBS domain-containing protein